VNGKDALAQSCRLLHLPGANFGARRCWREHENHRISLADQVADPLLPFLATGDALTVDEALKAAGIERRNQLAGEAQIVAAVGDEDAKLRSYITGFRRRTGCVMRDVCHCAPPPCTGY